MPDTPLHADLLVEFQNSLLDSLHVAMPGRVQSYDPSKQVADVQPMVRRKIFDADGNPVYEDLPVIPNVKVNWPQAGGFQMTFPLAVGDYVELIFHHSDFSQWRDTGDVSNPVSAARMSLGYPTAHPCMAPDSKPLSDASSSNAVWGKDGADQQIVNDGSTISIGKGATAFAARADKQDQFNTAVSTSVGSIQAPLLSLLTAFFGACSSSTDAILISAASTATTAMSPLTGLSTSTVSQISSVGSVAATIAKVK